MNILRSRFAPSLEVIKKHFEVLVLMLFLGSQGAAQMSHDGTTPKGMQPGAPAGSYSLSGFEHVNPYSGNLNFSLPLLKIGGRGGAQSSVNLTIDSAKWSVNFDSITEQATTFSWGSIHIFADATTFWTCSNDCTEPQTEYSNVVVLDGTVISETTGYYYSFVTVDDTVYGRRPGYGPGVLFSLSTSRGRLQPGGPWSGLTRLTFISPNGTQYELRDQQSQGKPTFYNYSNPNLSRGRVFASAESEALVFVSDADIVDQHSQGIPVVRYPSGYLYFPDGTLYRINQGNVEWIRDRNGNQIRYWYDANDRVITVVDSLNRQVDIAYGTSTNNPNDPNETFDDISYSIDGTAKRHIKVYRTKLDHALRGDFASGGPLSGVLNYTQMFPEIDGIVGPPNPYNPSEIATKVELPDTRSYDLRYTQYNEVARVKLPTGGAIEYDFVTPSSNGSHVFRPVKERRVYENGGSKQQGSAYDFKQTFSLTGRIDPTQSFCSTANRCTDATVQEFFYDTTAPSNDRLVSRSIHSYFGVPNALDHNFYPLWREGREYQSEIYAPNSSTPLRRTIQEWDQQPVSWAISHPEGTPPNNPRITSSITELLDTGTGSKLVSKQVYGYDDTPAFRAFNNRTDVWEYAFGDGAASNQLLRHTQTKYLITDASPTPTPSPSPEPSPTPGECRNCPCVGNCLMRGTSGPAAQEYARQNLIRLPAEVRVFQGIANNQEQLQGRIEFVYDETSLMSRDNITGWVDPGSLARGNLTTTKKWISPADDNAFVKTFARYDTVGNVIETTDGNNAGATTPKVTTIGYTDCFGSADSNARSGTAPPSLIQYTFAFPTSVTNALGQTTYAKYDYYSGLPVTTENNNGVKVNMFYNDFLGRITQVVRAAGTSLQSQSTFSYNDPEHIITTTSDVSTFGDNKHKIETIYDGMGRTTETHSFESSNGYITTKQFYDGLGRVIKATNPYRTTNDPTYGATETTYDALGRPTKVKTTPDYAEATVVYAGNTVTVTDQDSRKRKCILDSLGRLTSVFEASDSPGYAYETRYQYDALGDLTKVIQGPQDATNDQTRILVYDGLSRVNMVTNPESGTNSYTYDSNGNVLEKSEPRLLPGTSTHLKANYAYDALNRMTSRIYNDGTPEVHYFYDAQALPTGAPALVRGASIGQLLAVTYGSGTSINGTYYGYDNAGNATKSAQVTNGMTYPTMEYGYNLASNMSWQKYPSGREVTIAFNDRGSLSSVIGARSGETSKTYVSMFEYGAQGAATAMKFGNGLWERTSFNPRFQPTEIKLGTASNQESVLKLNYSYGTTDNNGNVKSQTITVPTIGAAAGFTATQSYEYDPMNRLTSATEMSGSIQNWKQTYSYDRFGNRRLSYTGGATTVPAEPITPQQIAIYNPEIGPANNRLVGYDYDLAGSVIRDAQNRTFDYDAENRLIRYNGGSTINNGDSASYSYDGVSKRVLKKIGGSMASTVFIYNIIGQLVAEYTDSQDPRTQMTGYVMTDTLGSPRVVTGQDQSVRGRHDFLPFGEDIGARWGRTGDQKYDTHVVRQRFTGYEKDSESELDFAQARYYSGAHGRFTSVDPLLSSADPMLPQSWNRYAYCLNNPLRYTDPTGLDPVHWVTNGNHDYRPLTEEQWTKFLDSDDIFKWYPVPAGTNIGILLDVNDFTGTGAFYLANNQLIGQEVVLGTDGNFQAAHPEDLCLNCEALIREEQRYAPALIQSMEIIVSVDTTLITGLSTLGSIGGATLELGSEATTETVTATTLHGAQRIAERSMSEADQAVTRTGTELLQRDGATVFLKEVTPGKFNALVDGEGGVVTAMKGWSWNSISRIAANYGWYSPF